jgi:hypothetical protein
MRLGDMTNESTNLFFNFRQESHRRFLYLISSNENYITVINDLVNHLRLASRQEWIDEEALDLLAFDIGKISSPDFLKQLRNRLRRLKDPFRIYEHFMIRLTDGESLISASSNSLPADSEVKKVINSIKSGGNASLYDDLLKIVGQYTVYCFTSGDLEPAYRGLNDIFFALQNNVKIDYSDFHFIVVNAIAEVFQVDATDERLWLRWSHSFRRIGDFASAELILWEAFRRRPESPRIAFSLLKSLGRTAYNYQNRVRLADHLCQRFAFNRWIEIERSRLKGNSRSFSQVLEGIKSAINLLERAKDNAFFEVPLLASLIAHNWKRLGRPEIRDRLVCDIEEKFGNEPRLLGRIVFWLMRDHHNVEAGEAILVGGLALGITSAENGAERRGRLAGLLSRFGGDEGLDRGIELLRGSNSQRDRNHLAQLLSMRCGQGDVLEADELLRNSLSLDENDEYALVQLAGLIYRHGIGANSKENALSLLDGIYQYNDYASSLRSTILSGDALDPANEGSDLANEMPKTGAMVEESDELFFTNRFEPGFAFGIPSSIATNGHLRKLKFEIDFGTKASSDAAIVEIKSLQKNVSGSYLTFVSEMYCNVGDIEDDPGQGAALLVKAFENADLDLLDKACELVPRFFALGDLARSVILSGSVANDNDSSIKEGRNVPWERIFVHKISRSRLARSLKIYRDETGISHVSQFTQRCFEDIVGAIVTIESVAA